MELPKRKPNRLSNYEYSTPGAYFITICVKDKQCVLGRIVGGGAFDAPYVQLSDYGRTVQKYIESGNNISGINVANYVVMPNHIHILLFVEETASSGMLKAQSPANSAVAHFVSTLKRFVHRDIGEQLFQRSYHDHVIRGERDYLKIWEYIDTNPIRWNQDCFFVEDRK